MTKKKKYNFNDNYISGFIQADGSFSVTFEKKKDSAIGVYPRAILTLSQKNIEKQFFEELKEHLGVGYVTNADNNTARPEEESFVISRSEDIINVVIPLLERCPIRGGKLRAYERWKHAAYLIQEGRHLTLEGVLELLELCYFMNFATSIRTDKKYLELLDLLKEKNGELPKYDFKEIDTKLEKVYQDKIYNLASTHPINLEFITGLIDGDGSFNFSFKANPRRIVSNFTVVQESIGKPTLEELRVFFGCGRVYDLSSASSRYQVENKADIRHIISKLEGAQFNIKRRVFDLFVEGNNYIDKYGYSNDKHMLYLIELLYGMNTSKKGRRKRTKEEYMEAINMSTPGKEKSKDV